jgi:hypothetical protein
METQEEAIQRLVADSGFKTEMCDSDGPWDYYSILRITWPDGKQEEHYDGGEPEDNSFGRDWHWVPSTIQEAFEAGVKVGVEACTTANGT